MSTKTYRASTLEECFNKVKSDMGGDAIILTSRAFQPILGRFGKTTHEVTATLDEAIIEQRWPKAVASSSGAKGRGVYGYSGGNKSAQPAEKATDRKPSSPPQNKLRMIDLGPARAIEIAEARAAELHGIERRPIEVRGLGEARRIELRDEDEDEPIRKPARSREHLAIRDYSPSPNRESADERMERLEAQVLTLSTSLKIIAEAANSRGKSGKNAPAQVAIPQMPQESKPNYDSLKKRLIDAGMVEPLARRLVDELRPGLSEADALEQLRTSIAGRVLIAGGIPQIAGKTRCIAFVGPTGVGKTTTLAKIAAKLTLVDRCKVAVITMDTQRVAASRQIEAYGEILRLPVRVAYDTDELMQHHADLTAQGFDFILVDTPGKSPNDAIAIGEVARSLKDLPNLTKYLVVPATLSGSNHDFVTGKFYSLTSPDAVILSKTDESADASHYANLLTAQAKFSLPVAYTTSGPRVPDDLAVADPHVMAEKLLG